MKIDGWTVLLQAANFLVLVLLLRRYLWRPVLAAIDRRKKQMDDAAAAASAREAAADERRTEYEERVITAERDRERLLADARAQIAREREEALASAQAESAARAAAARARLDEERREAAIGVAKDAVDLAIGVARKLLGEVRSPAIAAAYLARVCEHLDALPAEELERLRADAAAGGTVTVASAPALDAAGEREARARLAERLGDEVKVAFVTDPALLAGVELRLPHARIGHGLAEGLAAARAELLAGAEAAA